MAAELDAAEVDVLRQVEAGEVWVRSSAATVLRAELRGLIVVDLSGDTSRWVLTDAGREALAGG